MADEEKRRLRDEVAGLAAAVSALQMQLMQAQAAHHCPGCSCMQFYVQPYQPHLFPGYVPYVQPQVWCGTVTAGGANTIPDLTGPNTAGGYNPPGALGISN